MRNAFFAMVAAVQVVVIGAVLYAVGPGRHPQGTATDAAAPAPTADVRRPAVSEETTFHPSVVDDVEPAVVVTPLPAVPALQMDPVRPTADAGGPTPPVPATTPATMPAVSGPAVNPLSDGATPASAVLVPSTDGKLRLAILPMDLDTGITGADGAVLAENLQGQFRNPAYALIERMQILSLIKEKHFEGTGLFDSNSAGTIGRLASADCLLVGRMRKLRVTFQISAEIVDLHAKIKEHGVVFFRNLDDTPRQLADLAEQLGGTGERRPATDYLGDAMRANDLAEFRDLVASTAVDLDALPDHRCPLYELIVSGKVGSDMAVALVDGGAKMGKVTDGKTLLYLAAQNGLPDVVRAMVKKGVPVDVPNPQTGQTPLCAAIFYRKPETVAALLDLGADLDHQDERGVTPRQLAAKVDSPRVTAAIAAHAAGPAK